jgi:hypothetical protein
MKKWIALVLTLALAVTACGLAAAEPSEALKGIYEAMTGEGSDFAQIKDYSPEGSSVETQLEDDRFTITIAGTGSYDGSWTFVQDGDDLTLTVGKEDFFGAMLATYAVRAAGAYYGLNPRLVSGYVFGLSQLGTESDQFAMETDAEGNNTFRIYIGGPFDMKDLDKMVVTADMFMDPEPLGDEYVSKSVTMGKVILIATGNKDGLKVFIIEQGEPDDVAYQSLMNAVKLLQPKGWEDFTEKYTALADAAGEGWDVKLNLTKEEALKSYEDLNDGESYLLARFGDALEETAE